MNRPNDPGYHRVGPVPKAVEGMASGTVPNHSAAAWSPAPPCSCSPC